MDIVKAIPALGEQLQKLSNATDIPNPEKAEMRFRLLCAAAEQIFVPRAKVVPNSLWSNRPGRELHMSPCDFVRREYPTYGHGLLITDIRNCDRPLYTKLHKLKAKGGWPDDFILPTAQERDREIFEKIGGSITLGEIAEIAPPYIQELLRLYEAGRTRPSKKPKAIGLS